MNSRMPTRRCNQGKIPCQEINNIFGQKSVPHLALIPENIWRSLPSTQKVSCEFFEKGKELFPKISNEEALKEIRENVKLQFEEIKKICGEEIEPDNVEKEKEEKVLSEIEKEMKIYESPIRKVVKKDNCTRSVSDYEEDHIRNTSIFADQKVVEKLEDYLAID